MAPPSVSEGGFQVRHLVKLDRNCIYNKQQSFENGSYGQLISDHSQIKLISVLKMYLFSCMKPFLHNHQSTVQVNQSFWHINVVILYEINCIVAKFIIRPLENKPVYLNLLRSNPLQLLPLFSV